MDPSIKQRWVEALRSGQYAQGHEFLRMEGTYCCLGVLCDIVEPDSWRDNPEQQHAFASEDGEYLSYDACCALGLDPVLMVELYQRNDGVGYIPHTFAQLADIIEERA